ncbi:winged helix DNA-binding protein [Sandaracinobacteroides saxicola]|uniref:Winged helix DNA-binding protein n=1 Tax=Sandaracinobacteroides saxicola TaxID=2759707 RepID=A0A7G5II86_9SPHN|nr:winged helix DNA-binding protein [Sandaracinobacteroides saxicola]QMW23078.1 winged helix DNA-binding protein [Sandaracinobacteroides saxicola]
MTADHSAAALTRAELAMIRAVEAFGRWCVFLHKSVSGTPLGATDVWLLHSIRMRGEAQNLSELLLFLNRNDVSTLQYSLRKIEQSGLIERITGNSKREAGYRLTDKGRAATDAYARVRQELLVALIGDVNGLSPALEEGAAALERLTGLYDQSTQTVLNRKILGS